MAELIQNIERVVSPFVEAIGGFLVKVGIRGERGSKIIEIYADTDSGITIDQCAELSRNISAAFDREDIIAGSYRLEVSSPGLDHPLKLARQYKKNRGRQLKVTASIDGNTSVVTGVLEDIVEDSLGNGTKIILKTASGTSTEVPFSAVREAFVVPKLSR
jgi:ribosome maturation factor RimP